MVQINMLILEVLSIFSLEVLVNSGSR